MSPEQASADPQVDHRADIYSFGCLAYELLAGTSPFGGRSPQQMLAAHVSETPEPILKRRPNVPPALASLVMRCLEKRAGDRPQSADELLTALDAIATTPSGGMTPTSERLAAVKKSGARWVVVGAALVAVALLAAQQWNRVMGAKALTVGNTTPIAVGGDLEMMPAISPDGKLVAYAAATSSGSRIFVRQLDGGRARMLTGDVRGDHTFPRWSPDGSRVSFVNEGGIFVIPALTGGEPRQIVEDGGTHSWSPDGKEVVYVTNSQRAIKVQSLETGNVRTLVEGTFLHSPMLSPNGKVLAYAEGRLPELTNISANMVWTIVVGSNKPTRLSDSTHVNVSPVWTPDGKSVLFVSSAGGTRDVYQVPVTSNGAPSGPATRITTSLGAYWISLSADGHRMAYDVVRNFTNIFVAPITGAPQSISAGRQLTRDNQHIESLSLSSDGQWLAFDSDRGGNFDIYKMRVDGGEPIQLTTNPASDFAPKWSADDREIVFHTTRNGTRDVYIMNSDGNLERQVSSGPDQDFQPDLTPDGRRATWFAEGPQASTIKTATRDQNGSWSPSTSLRKDLDTLFGVQSRTPYPRITPDGKAVVFSHPYGLFLTAIDGGPTRKIAEPQNLTRNSQGIAFNRHDPKTVYITFAERGSLGIYSLPLTGGKPRLLLHDEPGMYFGRWEFATDGKVIYFTRAAFESDVWVMELNR
jgi:Tol biopolymer transport system component